MKARSHAPGAGTAADALKLLQELLDQKHKVREPDGSQKALSVRDIVLRQLLKSAAERGKGSAAAFKFMARYQADRAEAAERLQRSRRSRILPPIASYLIRGTLVLPFCCDISKVMDHIRTLDEEGLTEFMKKLRVEKVVPEEFLSDTWLMRDESYLRQPEAGGASA